MRFTGSRVAGLLVILAAPVATIAYALSLPMTTGPAFLAGLVCGLAVAVFVDLGLDLIER